MQLRKKKKRRKKRKKNNMQSHELTTRKKAKKRVGRGGKRGTYSGKGMKGQNSRAVARFQPLIRELFKRYPKLRGYRAKRGRHDEIIIGLDLLEKNFKKGDKINPQVLAERKLIRTMNKKPILVKILDRGELTKDLIIEGCEFSKSVEKQVKKAGGTITK